MVAAVVIVDRRCFLYGAAVETLPCSCYTGFLSNTFAIAAAGTCNSLPRTIITATTTSQFTRLLKTSLHTWLIMYHTSGASDSLLADELWCRYINWRLIGWSFIRLDFVSLLSVGLGPAVASVSCCLQWSEPNIYQGWQMCARLWHQWPVCTQHWSWPSTQTLWYWLCCCIT